MAEDRGHALLVRRVRSAVASDEGKCGVGSCSIIGWTLRAGDALRETLHVLCLSCVLCGDMRSRYGLMWLRR